MRSMLHVISSLVVAILLIGSIAGCASRHSEQVDAAEDRWKAMRSTLMLQMAQQQFDAGDLDQAQKTIAEAIKIDAQNARLYTLAGRVAMERGQLERSYHRFKAAIEIDPNLSQPYYYQGIVMQRWTRFDTSLENYRRAYELEPDNAAYLLAMSEMLVVLDRIDEAMELLQSKMTYFDLNAGIRMAIGQLFVIRGQYDQAVDYFRQAAVIRAGDLRIQEELAFALLGASQAKEASQIFERLTRHPEFTHRRDILRALGDSYLGCARPTQAKAVYTKITRENPLDVEAWIKLSEIALVEEDLQSALLVANKVKKLAPDRQEGFILSGVIWSKQGKIPQALAMFDQAAQLIPDDPTPILLRGIALERDGQLEAAAQAYAQALQRQPDDTRAKQLLANVTTQAQQKVLIRDE